MSDVREFLRPGARVVLGELRRMCESTPPMSASGGWYSVAKVAERLGASKNMTQNYFEELVRAELIESRPAPARTGRAMEYRALTRGERA